MSRARGEDTRGVTRAGAAAPARERAWLVAAALVAAAALLARLHNAFAYPPLHDYDAAGHALNVFALYQGRLPDPHSWSGFHPPLYYALGALLWHALPEAIPVHAALRLLSAAAGFGAIALAWRALRRVVSPTDAAVVATLVLCAPVVAIATSMLGNETSCALFTTAALARTMAIPDDPRAARRHGTITALVATLAALSKSTGLVALAVVGLAYAWQLRRAGVSFAVRALLAALAALSKSTGLVALGVVGLAYAWRLRRAGVSFAMRAMLAMGGVALVLVLPQYGRLAIETRSPLGVISGGQLADQAGNEMSVQPPGERHLADYVSFPVAALVAPSKDAPGMVQSVPGPLYAGTWADAQGAFLPTQVSVVRDAAAGAALLGLVPTLLAIAGLVRILRRRELRAVAATPLVFAALLFAAFLAQTWVVPRYTAVKASYLLSALLPAALALAVGVAEASGRWRTLWRAALLATAAYMTFLTWYGWWT